MREGVLPIRKNTKATRLKISRNPVIPFEIDILLIFRVKNCCDLVDAKSMSPEVVKEHNRKNRITANFFIPCQFRPQSSKRSLQGPHSPLWRYKPSFPALSRPGGRPRRRWSFSTKQAFFNSSNVSRSNPVIWRKDPSPAFL